MPPSDLPAPGHFYELDGELAVPSELTRGPWDEDSQHAGPPAALLGRALERLPVDDGTPMRFGRVTYEVLRPVPIAPLRVEAWLERGGRRVQMLGASLHDGDEEVMRARAWRLRTEEVELAADFPRAAPGHGPADGDDAPFFANGRGRRLPHGGRIPVRPGRVRRARARGRLDALARPSRGRGGS